MPDQTKIAKAFLDWVELSLLGSLNAHRHIILNHFAFAHRIVLTFHNLDSSPRHKLDFFSAAHRQCLHIVRPIILPQVPLLIQ